MPSITRRGSGRTDRQASAEARILATTERLLIEGTTFTELGLQRIALEAGVARSTLYGHFPDKAHLLMRLAGQMTDASFATIASWQPVGPGGDLAGFIELFDRAIAIYRQHAPLLRALDEVSAYDRSVARYWDDLLNRFVQYSERMIRDEQRAGRTPASVDAATASRLNVLGGHRFMVHHVLTCDSSQDASAARELARVWWYGILRRPGD